MKTSRNTSVGASSAAASPTVDPLTLRRVRTPGTTSVPTSAPSVVTSILRGFRVAWSGPGGDAGPGGRWLLLRPETAGGDTSTRTRTRQSRRPTLDSDVTASLRSGNMAWTPARARVSPATAQDPTSSTRRTAGMRSPVRTLVALLAGLAACLVPGVARAQGNLVLYCTPQEEWCRAMVTAFERDHRHQGQHDPQELRARTTPRSRPRPRTRRATSGGAAPAIRICRRRRRG